MKIFRLIPLLFLGTFVFPLHSQTIAEKKASFTKGGASGDLSKEMHRYLLQINIELKEQQELLRILYGEVEELYGKAAEAVSYQTLLEEINTVKSNITVLENSWRQLAAQNNTDEEYALWHQPDSTVGDLVIDYGSQEFVYLFDPDIGDIPLSVNSNIPIPKASWAEMLEIILAQNGVGVRQLNPYLRQLYLLQDDHSGVRAITNKRQELDIFSDNTRICFVLSPDAAEVRRIWFFLEKFVNQQTTEMQLIGRDIMIIGPVSEIKELLHLYDFIETNAGNYDYKVVSLRRVDAEEMGSILSAIFEQFQETNEGLVTDGLNKTTKSSSPKGVNGLKVITLAHVAQALFLIGTAEEIRKAEEIIDRVENEVGEARDKVIFTYTSKYTDTEELADILERVYNMMMSSGAGLEIHNESNMDNDQRVTVNDVKINPDFKTPQELYQDGYYQEGGYIVNPAPIRPGMTRQGNPHPNKNRQNFIVDPKTGAIVMVVEAIALNKLKELIRKLDIPKKLVQIEVLLFEQRNSNDTRYGLNLLRLGDMASQTNTTSLAFNDLAASPLNLGVTEFFLSRFNPAKGLSAAFDVAYKFLLTRDDITINSNPSVVTENQTTAIIAINEEISVNTGIFEVETVKGVTLKDSFTRAQYGITIKVTPTIHMREDGTWNADDDPTDYVTLETDITFQTILPGTDPNRPDVINRHIENRVRIADGQTVILGGLRRKDTNDHKEAIPFLGELPGLGKLFSNTRLTDASSEMFIFLTPKIIADPAEELVRLRNDEMTRRPGDIPAFMCRLVQARECERNRCLKGSMMMLFGRPPERCFYRIGEYDGR